MLSTEDRKRERILHLQQQLACHQRERARIERVPPLARTIEQIEMIGHPLQLEGVITSMLRGDNP